MAIGALIVMLGGLPAAAGPAPLAWSPDGRWIAYVLAERPAAVSLPLGSLLVPAGVTAETDAEGTPAVFRLWATRPESRESVLLAESDRVLTSPAWGPGGTSLAFGRIAGPAGAPPRFELVIQEALDRQRVAWSEEMGPDRRELTDLLAGAPIAWSADGRFLAAPHVAPAGVAIVRVEDGQLMRVLEGASGLGWAPQGHRSAFYRDNALHVLDSPTAEPRQRSIAPDAEHLPAVRWGRDGQTILHILRADVPGAGPGRPRMPGERADLVAIDADTGQVTPLRSLLHAPVLDGNVFRSASYTLDASGEQLFYATVVDGQSSQIAWSFPRQNAIRARFNPVDESVGLGDLAVSSDATRLALRAVSGPSGLGLVALCDPITTGLTPLIPDDDARAAWIAVLGRAAASVLEEVPAHDGGSLLPRLVTLPAPSEFLAQSTLLPRLRHLGRIGHQLTEIPLPSSPPAAGLGAALAEARLVFAYWDHDPDRPLASYEAAFHALEDLESVSSPGPDPAARLLARAMIATGLGQREAALACIEGLRVGQPVGPLRIEETGRGFVVEGLTDPMAGWLAQLEAAIRSGSPPESPDSDRLPAAESLLQPGLRADEVQILPGP